MAVSLALALLAVTAPASSGELTPIPVKTADRPISLGSPAADGRWFGWARYNRSLNTRNYFVQRGTKPRVRINPKGTSAFGAGISRRTLVYQQWRGNDPSSGNLYRVNLRTGRRAQLSDRVNTPADESDPTLSGRYVLFERFFKRGGVSVDRVMLYDRRTGALRVLGTAKDGPGDDLHHPSVFVGQVNGAYAVGGRATFAMSSSPNASYVFRVNIRRDIKTRIPHPIGFVDLHPSVSSDGTVYFVRESKRGLPAQIIKKPVGAPAEVLYTVPKAGPDAMDLYVDDRTKARHVYFTFGRDFFPLPGDIYKLIDPLPSP